jgi:hypothetical protein
MEADECKMNFASGLGVVSIVACGMGDDVVEKWAYWYVASDFVPKEATEEIWGHRCVASDVIIIDSGWIAVVVCAGDTPPTAVRLLGIKRN